MQPKPWYQSKTVWWNVASGVVAIAASFAAPGVLTDPHAVAIAGAVVTIGNVALRVLATNQPIGTAAA